MRRRQFITLLSGAAAEWPLGASARQPAMPVIGFLSSGSRELDGSRLTAFHEGLDEAGYVEGRNVTMEVSWAENHTDRLPALAAERGLADLQAFEVLSFSALVRGMLCLRSQPDRVEAIGKLVAKDLRQKAEASSHARNGQVRMSAPQVG
jgi:hypothetical protein